MPLDPESFDRLIATVPATRTRAAASTQALPIASSCLAPGSQM
jgi:hypothetical protein